MKKIYAVFLTTTALSHFCTACDDFALKEDAPILPSVPTIPLPLTPLMPETILWQRVIMTLPCYQKV